jgi:alpha-D-ribose 1-methylphosphonate 5-triphosphate synthase subunit PhnH
MYESLRNRVADATELFRAAFSAAETEETPRNLDDLADACDALMRATARVLIEAKRGRANANA